MVKLSVNFVGGILVIEGPVSGRRYEYNPIRGDTYLFVEDADVQKLKEKKTRSGCGCGPDGKTFVGGTVEEDLFKEIS